ncbi:MAG TPA: SufD family Fe-S cluster assembly protein, partial [Pyrinomonadaceae bacterium]
MSQAVKEKSTYADAFREFAGAREGESSWVGRLREGAFGRFEESGFPTTDDEEWKYTNVAPLARKAFRPAADEKVGVERAAVERFVSAEARRSILVFVNGVYSPEHSLHQAIPAHVALVDLGTALADEETLRGDEPEVLRNHLGRLSGAGGDAFSALNTAFVDGGLMLRVPAGVALESPVQLLFLTAPGATEAVTFPRVLVVAEANSRLDLIETYAAVGDAEYFTDAVVEVFVGEGARVTHYKVQDEGGRAFHIASTRADVARDASYELTTVTLGARL